MCGSKVPMVVVEEHNEAFYVWNYAIKKGLIPPTGNALLHIDEHSDMSSGRFRKSIHGLNGDLGEIRTFTRTELTIDSFISAAIYMGIFSKVRWVKQLHEGSTLNQDIPMYVRSYNDTGKKLVIGRKTDILLHEQVREEINIRYFDYCRLHVDQISSQEPVVLDIDLDFFSCTGHPYRHKELLIEISANEFNAFSQNPYHRLNYLFSRIELLHRDGKYYYLINNYDEIYLEKTQVDAQVVIQRISDLAAILRREKITPLLITICRSRFSGFTPEDQWQLIEETLWGQLQALYDIEMMSVEEL